MTSKEFETEIISSFIPFYEFIRKGYFSKSIQFANEPTYNSQLRIGETNDHFVAELIGSKKFKKRKSVQLATRVIERIENINYFVLGDHNLGDNELATMNIAGDNCEISGIFLANTNARMEIEQRLGTEIAPSGIIYESGTIPIQLSQQINNVLLHQIDLLRTKSSNIYYRYISLLFVVKKSHSKLSFKKWIQEKITTNWHDQRPLGIDLSENKVNYRLSRSLISLSEQNLSERVIDKYIHQHAKMFANAMGYKRAMAQIELKWIDREKDDPKTSIPDYLMERKDGTFHILDLKKGFLGRRLVKGKIGRERFIDYVAELVAQLINYERYFDKEENRKFAKVNYGIEVNNEIKLIGVVGGFYEYREISVSKILKQYSNKISIISYYDLASLIKKLK